MVEFITHYSYRSRTPRKLSKKVLVVPDQTISLKTMVTKYVKGLPISAPQLPGIATEDELAIDFKKLDLAEQEEMTNRALDELKFFDDAKTLKLQQDAAEAKKQAEKDQQELEELRKFKEKLSSNTP